jgi:hypothetical protein
MTMLALSHLGDRACRVRAGHEPTQVRLSISSASTHEAALQFDGPLALALADRFRISGATATWEGITA